MAKIGVWDIEKVKICNLPQKAASAFASATGGLTEAEYEPVLYIGSQEDKEEGTSYCILAVQTLVTPEAPKRLVKMVIRDGLDGKVTLVSVRGLLI